QDGVLALARGDDMRAAFGAEIPRLAGRRFKTLEHVFAPDPAKAVAGDVGDGRKGRSMRLAAGAAVAMNDRSGIGIDFVRHASAQAVSSKHGVSYQIRFQGVFASAAKQSTSPFAARW